ncbi:MAG TPA: hypothetical protein PK668_06815 [Myxococcota bacterium]|nr:hypothetical protein [Myxococcota bacterium]HRY92445.1 hypothetical protein [Myxococcota bacterium]HSA23372.1 hypothetical protein [Myxococcota bacterium]
MASRLLLLACLGLGCDDGGSGEPDGGFDADDDGGAGLDCEVLGAPSVRPAALGIIPVGEPASCPDIRGIYDVVMYCLLDVNHAVEIEQQGCAISFVLDSVPGCRGNLNADLALYVECPDLLFPCEGEVNLLGQTLLYCGPQCRFLFEPTWERVACTSHGDPACQARGEVCSIAYEQGGLAARCVRPLPGGLPPGAACSDDYVLRCENSLCLSERCSAPCTDDSQCTAIPGASCQPVFFSVGPRDLPVQGEVNLCISNVYGNGRCTHQADCTRATCMPVPGQDDVELLCVRGGWDPSAPVPCETDLDCVQAETCGQVEVFDLELRPHVIAACVPRPGECARDSDCPVGEACAVSVEGDPPRFVSRCACGGGPGWWPTTGLACARDQDCFSGWCGPDRTCQGLCRDSLADCPLEAPDCRPHLFELGDQGATPPSLDLLTLCEARPAGCSREQDCPAGQSCNMVPLLIPNDAGGVCEPFGPGQVGLAEPCPEGPAICRSGLCLRDPADIPEAAYCSQLCEQEEDCLYPTLFTCRELRFEGARGVPQTARVCTRRQ